MGTKLLHYLNRILFVGAFGLAGLAVLEEVSNRFGYTLTVTAGFSAGRLLEISAIAVLFVIALQLREIKHSGERTPDADSFTEG